MENPLFCDDNTALDPADPNVIVLDLESKINLSIHLSWHSSTGDNSTAICYSNNTSLSINKAMNSNNFKATIRLSPPHSKASLVA
jgi:hypothetical protein